MGETSTVERRIRVIHVSTIGMTATNLLRPQCEYLKKLNYEVGFVFSPDPSSRRILASAGFDVFEVHISRSISCTDVVSVLELAKYFRRTSPDIVHTHTSKAGVVGRLAARLACVPYVIHTIHGFPFIDGQHPLKYNFYTTIERWAGRLTDMLLSQSMEDVSTAERLGIRARCGYPVYIGNGIDVNRFDPERLSRVKQDVLREIGISTQTVITIIGRQTIEKGYLELVEALGMLKHLEWSALFVGGDEGAGNLIRRRLSDLDIEKRVKLLGHRTDVERLLAVTDIFVLPSYREGVPRSVIEAQAMAIPVVTTNIRGCREVVADGKTGYLVPPRDPNGLATALLSLLTDAQKRAAMGKEGRARVEENFDERLVFERIAQSYEMLVTDRIREGF